MHRFGRDPTCTTPACVVAASELLRSMAPPSRAIDPCTNFRDYVCGGWDSRHDLADNQAELSRRTQMEDSTQALLYRILESDGPAAAPAGSDEDDGHAAAEAANFGKMKRAYASCMNEGQVAVAGLRPLIELVRGVQHAFEPAPPPDGEPEPGDHDLTDALIYLLNHGVDALISFRTKVSRRHPALGPPPR